MMTARQEKAMEIFVKGHALPLGERTCIMGILNVTPDSFSDGGKYLDVQAAARHAKKMVQMGADIIDIGGESSRPGAEEVTVDEELKRVIPVIKALKGIVDVPISVDTYKSEVASQALSEGASLINDITALRGDDNMVRVIKDFQAGVILMHMKGVPRTMQELPRYDDVMAEVIAYLSESIGMAEDAGIDPSRIILDPGIGFGKTPEHNIAILRELDKLSRLGKPVLIGVSRKSFIGKLTGKSVDKREFGTAAAVAAAIMKGADIVRVHDIDDMMDVVKVIDAVMRGK